MWGKHIGLDVSALFAGVSMLPAFSPNPQQGFVVAGLLIYALILIHSSTLFQCFRRGLLFGLGLYGVGLYWLFVTADYVAAEFSLIITLINFGIVLLMCLYPAGVACILYFFKKRGGGYFLLALPPVWVLGEWLRSWILTGLPLYQLGHAFIDSPLAGFAPVGGEFAVTLVATVCITGVVGMLIQSGWQSKILLAGIVVVTLTSGWLLQQLTWTQYDKTLNVRVLHGMPDQQKKSKRYYAVDTIKDYLERSQIKPLPQLVIWPESSIALDLQQVYRYLQRDAAMLAEQGTALLLGGYLQENGNTYNALLLANDPTVHYFKRHLVPFGEYTPEWPFIGSALGGLLPSENNGHLSHGQSEQPLVMAGNAKVAPIICYELLFPEELRHQWQAANVLLFTSDLNWFKETWGIHQLFQLSRLRAIESGKYLLASTSYGVTGIIRDQGEILRLVSDTDPEKWLDSPIQLRSGATPYTLYGNRPIIFLCFAALGLLIWRSGWQANRTPATQH